MYIVKIEAIDKNFHSFQSQSHRKECWLDGYIEVPKDLESTLVECGGYCDLNIEDGILKSITPRLDLKPQETDPTSLPTTDEILNTLLGVTDDE